MTIKTNIKTAAAILCTFVYLQICTFAQNVGINATGATPDNSAMLDVTSNTKGMLIPRMTGTEKYAITTPATGLLIFQTDTVGFWYYDGSKWIPLLSSTSSTGGSTGGWGLTGNSGTTASNFLGTTDNVSLRFKTNDTTRVIVDSLGRVGVGTTSPISKLAVQHTAFPAFIFQRNFTIDANTFRSIGSMVVANTGAAAANGFGPCLRFDIVDNSTGNDITLNNGYLGDIGAVRNGANNSGDLVFRTTNAGGATENMRIKSAGNVGIGTTSPYAKLNVKQGTSDVVGVRISRAQADGNPMLQFSDDVTYNNNIQLVAGTYNLAIAPTFGNVGIGCTDPKYKLHVIGDIASSATIRGVNAYVTGAITACSDIRYKKDITPLPNALSNMMKLQGVNYHWKTKEFPEKQFTEGNQIGFIAQDLEKIIPEVVMTDKEGYKSVDYSRLTPVLVEAIKELKAENDSLQEMLKQVQHDKQQDNAKQQVEIENLKIAIQTLKELITTNTVSK